MNRKSLARPAPHLVVAASLWTLESHPSPRREWPLARKVRAVAEAGFDAVEGQAHLHPGLGELLRENRLRFSGLFAAEKIADFPGLLQAQAAIGAERATVQLRPPTASPAEALRKTRSLLRAARRLGLPVSLETHRGTITESPEATEALADAYAKAEGELLPLALDFAHPAVVRHLKPFQFAEILLRRADLVQHARMFHCRPFNGQHAQVPVTDGAGRLTREFRAWLEFAEALLACWLAGPRPGNELWVCPEIGPVGIHGYNLTTMPPSWDQAVVCRRELARLWRRLLAKSRRARTAQ